MLRASSLAELEPLARARPARLLALHGPPIARQQPLLAQLLAMALVGETQRPRDREAERARLAGDAATAHQRPYIERTERVRGREGLLDVRDERRPGKVIAQRAPIDVPFSRARREVDARDP